MKKFYITHIAAIMVTMLSISLSGMEESPNQQTTENNNIVIIVEPHGGSFPITKNNESEIKKYFHPFGIIPNSTTKEVIPVIVKQQQITQYEKDKKIITTNDQCAFNTPQILPLEIFTNKQPIFGVSNNQKIVFSSTHYSANSIHSHEELINFDQLTTKNQTLKKQIINAKNFQTCLEQASLNDDTTLKDDTISELTFLIKKPQENNIVDEKKDLPSEAMPVFFESLIKQAYDRQLEMIDLIKKQDQQNFSTYILEKTNLNQIILDTYNDLQKSAQIEQINDNIPNNAIASLKTLNLEKRLLVYHIFFERKFNNDIESLQLPAGISKMIEKCNKFTTIIQYNEAKKQGNIINIPRKIAKLCETIKLMAEDDLKNKQVKIIPYPIPPHIGKNIMIIFTNLIDQNLKLLCDDLEKDAITQYENQLKKDIAEHPLDTLAQLLYITDYLGLAKTKTKLVDNKEITKPLILDSLLKQYFIEKLIKESYENCLVIIKNLYKKCHTDFDLQCFDINNNQSLTLEQALLIHHIVTDQNFPNNLEKFNITDQTVTQPVKTILDRCQSLEIIIEKNKIEMAENKKKKEEQIAKDKADKQKEYNSFRARFMRFIKPIIAYKKSIGLLTISAVIYIYTQIYPSKLNQLKTILLPKIFNLFQY